MQLKAIALKNAVKLRAIALARVRNRQELLTDAAAREVFSEADLLDYYELAAHGFHNFVRPCGVNVAVF